MNTPQTQPPASLGAATGSGFYRAYVEVLKGNRNDKYETGTQTDLQRIAGNAVDARGQQFLTKHEKKRF